jgi:superfamily II DNA or RNA helicase
MTKLLVKEKYSKIVDENDPDFLKALHHHLSFKYEGAEFSPAFKRGFWDGREKLLSKKLEFYSGLVNYVNDFYKLNNKQLEIIDQRSPIVDAPSIDISYNLEKLRLTPYDYQLDAIEYAIKRDRAIFKHATGSGKSLTTALITARLGKSTIVYVISKELLHQFHSFFSSLFDEKIGIIGDGVCEIGNITIASIWTVGRALGLKPKDMSLEDMSSNEKFDENNTQKIIECVKNAKVNHFDECHISATKTIRTIYKTMQPERLYGWSGTPQREDGADLLLTAILSDNIHEVSASKLIRRGILAKPMIKFVYVKGYAKYDTPYPTVYSDHIVNNEYRNNLILSETKTLIDKGYQVLILFRTINHGKILNELFEKKGIEAGFLSGKDTTKKRAEVKDNLLSGKSRCAIVSTIYDLGVDIKTLNALVLAGAGKSSVRATQRIGRVIRGGGKDKPFAAVVDFLDDIRFFKKQALTRKSIYELEPEFVIKMPNEIVKK